VEVSGFEPPTSALQPFRRSLDLCKLALCGFLPAVLVPIGSHRFSGFLSAIRDQYAVTFASGGRFWGEIGEPPRGLHGLPNAFARHQMELQSLLHACPWQVGLPSRAANTVSPGLGTSRSSPPTTCL